MLIPNGKSWTRATTKQELDEASAKLRALLEDAMLTQVEAADMLGIDHRTMRRYVLGQVGYSYCVWFAMLVVHEQKTAEKPNADALRAMKQDELEREFHKWSAQRSQCAGASRAYARAADHIRAIQAELVRRDEDGRPSVQHQAAADKAWSDPEFRAGGSERALKAAATRRRNQGQPRD
jgi:hypothetical protein